MGAAVGALAGVLGAWLDVASTILWLSSPTDQRRLIAGFTLLGGGAGALVGAVCGAILGGGSRGGEASFRSVFFRALALTTVPGGVCGWWLFTGGRMRRLPGQWALRPISGLLVALACALSIALLVRAVLAAARAGGVRRAGLGGGLAVGAMALHGADHRLFPRLYEYLHTVLGAATGALLAGAVWLLASRAIARRFSGGRAGGAIVFGALLSLVVGHGALTRWDNVRAEVFGTHAPFVRHIAQGIESLPRSTRGSDARSLARIAQERAERARAARRRESDPTLPLSAGAHVLLITVDALRADRTDAAHAPSLARLASEGVRFHRAYAQAPHSSYSITTLHTGEFLHETVALGQPQPLETLADRFGAAGYRTVALYTQGIFFTEGERLTAYRDAHLGFSRAEHRDLDARATTDAALRELDESARRGEPPTFLWAHYFDAHEPYRGGGPTPIARYDSAVRAVDAEVSRLVREARARLRRPVVIALSADHGEEFGEHGGVYHGSTLYEEQVRVPLVVIAPGVTPREVSTPVGLIDLGPTLLGLAGVARPSTMRGRDLRPWMAGRPAADEPVFSAVNTRTMVVRGDRKLVADLRWGVRELYDLRADPGERENLAGTDPAAVTALEGEVLGWIASLGGASGDEARARLGDATAIAGLVRRALSETEGRARRLAALEAVSSARDRTVLGPLRSLLAASDPDLRAQAAILLGAAGFDEAREALRPLLWSERFALRSRAARSLATLGDPAASRGLIELLRAGDEAQRAEATDGLARIGPNEGAVGPLLAALEDDHLRYRAALALGVAGGARAVSTLARIAREDRAEDARAWAVAGLGMTRDPSAISLVIERMTRDTSAQRYAVGALGALRASGVDLAGVALADGMTLAREGRAECGVFDADAPWPTLAARACAVEDTLPLVVRGRSVDLSGAVTVWFAARGDGALVVQREGREVLRFALEPTMRTWRARVERGAFGRVEGDSITSIPLALHGAGRWFFGYLAIVPEASSSGANVR